jgi:hypothetical protein
VRAGLELQRAGADPALGAVDLHAAANQLLAEVDELLDALLEGGELLGVVGLYQRLPVLDDLENAFVELEQPVAVFLHHREHGLEAVFLTNDFDDPLEGFDTSRYAPDMDARRAARIEALAATRKQEHAYTISTQELVEDAVDHADAQHAEHRDAWQAGAPMKVPI